jgi:hypothetical protein
MRDFADVHAQVRPLRREEVALSLRQVDRVVLVVGFDEPYVVHRASQSVRPSEQIEALFYIFPLVDRLATVERDRRFLIGIILAGAPHRPVLQILMAVFVLPFIMSLIIDSD